MAIACAFCPEDLKPFMSEDVCYRTIFATISLSHFVGMCTPTNREARKKLTGKRFFLHFMGRDRGYDVDFLLMKGGNLLPRLEMAKHPMMSSLFSCSFSFSF